MTPHSAGGRPPDPPPVDRADHVRRAYAELGTLVLDWEAKHLLTSAETLQCLLRCGQERLAHVLQAERRDGAIARGMGGPPKQNEVES